MSVTEAADVFELSRPGQAEPVRFAFTRGEQRDHIAWLVRTHGLASYEAPTPAIFAALVPDAPGLVLDIGANTGIFTLLAAATSHHVRVCAFEPLDSVRALLGANVARNPDLARRIAVEPCALSDRRCVAAFFETINDQGLLSTSSSLEQSHAAAIGHHVQREVATETLDDWADRAPAHAQWPIRLIKIDVEGHEHAVIAGGRRTIERHRPIIIVELLGGAQFAALERMMAALRYRDFALAPGGLRSNSRLCFQPDAWNHLLCPAEAIEHIAMICRGLDLELTED